MRGPRDAFDDVHLRERAARERLGVARGEQRADAVSRRTQRGDERRADQRVADAVDAYEDDVQRSCSRSASAAHSAARYVPSR
ncbi:MAG: hypothetical protein NVS4B5_09030 [Vulcanimicrobiaceae bacterium]